MQISGTINYDPVHRVSRKKEYAVKRTYLVEGLKLVFDALVRSPPHSKHCKKVLQEYLESPSKYIATANKRIDEKKVDEIYELFHRLDIDTSNFDELNEFLARVEDKLCRTKTHPWTAIVRVDKKVVDPFRQELKDKNIVITPSAWGPHITWVKREIPTDDGQLLWGFREGHNVNITVEPKLIRNKRGYWWVDIECPELAAFRKELGLNPRPRVPLHLTIGKEVSCAGNSRK